MNPQTTNDTNDGITELSSIKPNPQPSSTNPTSQSNPIKDQQNSTPSKPIAQGAYEKPSKTNPEQVPSIGSDVEKNVSKDSLHTLTPEGATKSNNQNLPEQEKPAPIIDKQKEIVEPIQPINLDPQNIPEKPVSVIAEKPLNQAPLDNQNNTNSLPPLPPLPKEQTSQISQQGKENTAEKQKEKTHKQGSSKSVTVIFIIFISIAILSLGGFLIYKNYSEQEIITTFEECMATEGSVLEESYPPVCLTKSGTRFVAEVPAMEEPINEMPIPIEPGPEPLKEKTVSEICYEQASSVECPEGTQCMTNPASSFCECMGGKIEIKESETGDQYGMCLIGGAEYDEWEYFRMNAPEKNEADGETTPTDSGPSESEIGSPFENIRELDYTLDKSEGTCTADSQCVWENQGCGGGHGICTNDPEKYKDVITTCEVDPNFPSNLGYTCGCIETLGKCGWEK